MPESLAEEIRKSWRAMGACPVAVRSSATAEDMAEASMAGQYDTFLDINSEEGLLDAVQCCWASLDSPRTRTYLTEHGINLATVAMAVVVQKLVPADVAGVLFSANPQTGSRCEMLIEASWGLGESVVSGRVQPDVLRLETDSGRVLAATISDKQIWIKPGEEEEKPVDEDRRRIPCLRSAEVTKLWQLGRRAAEHFGRPQDIEWAIHNGSLYLLQSRPITTLEHAEAYEQLLQSTRAQLREMLSQNCGPFVLHNISETLKHPTPLTWSVIQKFMSGDGGFGRMYKQVGFEPSPRVCKDGFLHRIGGRPYMDLSLAAEMFFADYPFKYDLEELRKNPDAAQSPPTIPTGSFSQRMSAGRRAAKVSAAVHALSNELDQKLSTDIIPKFVAWCSEEKKRNLQSLDTQQLIDLWNTRHDRVLNDFAPWPLLPSMVCAMALAELKTLLEENFWDDDPEQLAAGLAASRQPDNTLIASAHLYELANNKRSLDAWLSDYGHRAPDEFDLATPRWRERPDELIAMSNRLRDGTNPLDLHHEHLRRSDEKLASLKLRLNANDAQDLDSRLKLVRRYIHFREDGKYYLMLGYDLLRDVIVEIGRRLDIGDDAFQLTLEELFDALRVGFAPHHLINQRKILYAAESKLTLPFIIDSQAIDTLGQPPKLSTASSHQAFPVSPGHASGPARIVLSPDSAGDLGKNYILICPSTDPNWTPLFVNAAGLILECGGTLSHGAVVAREMNIPAVVLSGAPQLLKEGEEITVDGRHGSIHRNSGTEMGTQLFSTPAINEKPSPDDLRIPRNLIPPVPARKERRAARLRNIFFLVWGIYLLAVFLLPDNWLYQPSLHFLDVILWPIIAYLGKPAVVVIVAALFAAGTMLIQRFLTDNARLREAKKRSNLLIKESNQLPKDSPRAQLLIRLAAPVQTRIFAAALVPLALLLGPMVMTFLYLPARVDPANWNPVPGSSFTVVATVNSDIREPITISAASPLSLDDPTSSSKTLPPIRETLERMRGKWQQPGSTNLPWEQLSREQAMADLRDYLAHGIPPQSVSWKINSTPNQAGRFPIQISIPKHPPLTINAVLGESHAPEPLEITDHDLKGIVSARIVHPRSDQKRTFWAPFAWAGKPWDTGWLWLYLIVYLPVMFGCKWILGVP
ncbi:MAG TPA: PEP/pyruvate-binding domain-containing protein [Tepidisphaeraceae bacterium]|nr:PEP/pyruvate-binding domain-containing protein [Tepidisphaeraceae bacterium]